jgi:hypothetical protein
MPLSVKLNAIQDLKAFNINILLHSGSHISPPFIFRQGHEVSGGLELARPMQHTPTEKELDG